MTMNRRISGYLGIAALVIAVPWVSGCDALFATPEDNPPRAVLRTPPEPDLSSPAGIPAQYDPIDQSQSRLLALVESRTWPRRNDPFALLPEERRFDEQQRTARIVQDSGGFRNYFDWQDPTQLPGQDEPTQVVPLPSWRLSGIIQSEDGIRAILITSPGQAAIDIRPGSFVPPHWTVVSIDLEKAVLRRPRNLVPNELVVPLRPNFQ
jgi:hypothetical protein